MNSGSVGISAMNKFGETNNDVVFIIVTKMQKLKSMCYVCM